MRQIRKYRKSILRHVLSLPARIFQSAAEEMVERNNVFGSNHVGVPKHQHDWLRTTFAPAEIMENGTWKPAQWTCR